jgi:hypothetical protein
MKFTVNPKVNVVEGEKHGADAKRAREEAARKAIDLERLLPGESPSSSFIDDCRHWLRVYNELLQLKRQVIDATTAVEAKAEPDVRSEIEQTDMVIMRAEAERFERRIAFWEKRLAQLEKSELSRRA